MDWSLKIPSEPLKLPLEGKYIIFSDLHRDKFRSKAGDFWKNSDLYLHAIQYYLKNSHTLIENGDGEELWQFSLKEIMHSHKEIYETLSKFYKQDRLHLIYGNHNVDMNIRLFHRYWTDKYLPKAKYHPMLLIGDHILVTHGQQWDLVYKLGFIPVRLIVRLWKYMEYLGFSSFDPSIPAANPNQGMKIDKRIIRWGKDYGYIMICGHTHHAKFMPDGDYYFNSGCGTVKDRLTGLELDNGQISLIRWMLHTDGTFTREVIANSKLPKSRKELKAIYRKKLVTKEKRKIVTIFGSSAPKPKDTEYKFAYSIGKALAENGFVIKNGGYAGTMEASAKGAFDAGGESIGITLSSSKWGNGNKYLSVRYAATNLFERLQKLIEDSHAFVILPGSTGTQAELVLLTEMLNKGLIKSVPIYLYGEHWDEQVELFEKIAPGIKKKFIKFTSSDEIIKHLKK